MAGRNVLIRHLPAVETLGAATVICTDKTGTLTENRMRARAVFLGGTSYDLASTRLDELAEAFGPFFETASLCQNLKATDGQDARRFLGDPTEVALVEMAQAVLRGDLGWPRVGEVPFDSDRMRLSVLHRKPGGLALSTKGALEAVLPLCDRVITGSATRPMTPSLRETFLRAQGSMAEGGLRVLAVAYRGVSEGKPRESWERGLILAGLVGLEDPPRAEVPEAVRRCREAGIRVIMVTGDHPRTACAVARQVGLTRSGRPVAITGEELRRLSDTQLRPALDAPEVVFARIAADQKSRIVRALKQKREVVAVTGDGVNDAPALRQADIGIAMGVSGTDVAREAADMVLTDDNFAGIVAAVEEGRAVFDNVRKFLAYILTHNVAELVPYLAFVLLKVPLALTVLQILAIDLGTDVLPALALGAERPEPDVMKRPPRSRRERLLSWGVLARVYLFLGLIESGAAMSAFFLVLRRGGWAFGRAFSEGDPLYRQATTACLASVVVMQVTNVFLCRSARGSTLARGLLGNKLILAGLGAEILLLLGIVYAPWGNAVFATAPLPARVWLFTLPFAAGMLLLEEGRKWLARRRAERPAWSGDRRTRGRGGLRATASRQPAKGPCGPDRFPDRPVRGSREQRGLSSPGAELAPRLFRTRALGQ
jgi:calcium-translocating P-type ATPase